MKLDRKFGYVLILIWYYTLITIYSIQLGFTDVLASVLITTVISYLWIIRAAYKMGAYEMMSYKDLVINVFIYTFASYYITMMTIFLSPQAFDALKIFLMIMPTCVWTFIWADFYVQKTRGGGS
jgi:accessory gene regulator protein AgrB